MRDLLICFILTIYCTAILAVCTFPENLRNSTWIDSDKGVLEFTSTHMTGFEFSGFSTDYNPGWECFHNETGSLATLILKANITISPFGDNLNYRPYLCLRMTAVTSYSYYYYIHAPEQPNLRYQAMNIIPDSNIITDPEQNVCNFVAVTDLTDNQYHVLVTEGFENETIQTCPSVFFGVYSYSVTDQDASSTTCGTGDERWDVCTDRQTMTFNYTTCTTPIAYSANGAVFCVVTLTSGSYTLHTVYNLDPTVDNTNTYRFTCFVSSLESDGSLKTSQSPMSCTKEQTPTAQPTLSNSTVVGLNMVLTPIVLCPLSTDAGSSSSTATGAIVGGTVGGIAFIAICVIIAYLCLKYSFCARLCRRKAKSKPPEKAIESLEDGKSGEKAIKSQENGKPVQTKNKPQENGNHLLPGVTMPEDDQTESQMGFTEDGHEKENHSVENTGTGIEQNENYFTNIEILNADSPIRIQEDPLQRPDDEVQNIYIPQFSHVNELVQSENVHLNKNRNDAFDIEVMRVVKTTGPILSKDGQHLNSTENICADYDAAMTYNTCKEREPEKREPFVIEKRPLSARTFEFARDDSGIETESVSKQNTIIDISRLHRSEGNLVECVDNEKKSAKRTHSFRSVLNLGSIQWNFSYESPYALTLEQKQSAARRKHQMQKRKRNQERIKRNKADERKMKNEEAFKKWSERKREETLIKFDEMKRLSAKDRVYKYKL